MSTQLRGKKRGCAAMPSAAKITIGDSSEDASPTESAMLGPDSPTNAGGGDLDKQGGALVIPVKSAVVEMMINEIGVAIRRRALNNPGGGKKGHHRELQKEGCRLKKKN